MTVFIYLISRKFHSTWGIPGTEVTGTPAEIKMKQGTGWEWHVYSSTYILTTPGH